MFSLGSNMPLVPFASYFSVLPVITGLCLQVLFYSILPCYREMFIVNDGNKSLVTAINNQISALSSRLDYDLMAHMPQKIC